MNYIMKRSSMKNEMTQIKFTIESDIVSVFKERCEAEGVSMASVVRQYMAGYIPVKTGGGAAKTDTRPHRRKVVRETVDLLEKVLQDEKAYRDAIPEVFKERRYSADSACEELKYAINCLRDAF